MGNTGADVLCKDGWQPTTTVLMGTRAAPGWDAYIPSLLAQSVPADEVLIVIDRSTNKEERVDFQQRWPQLRFIFNDENMGIPRSMNRGLREAKGEVIFRADDDDSYMPTRIERQLATMNEADADFVTSWAEGACSSDGRGCYLIKSPTDDASIRAALLRRNVLLHPTLAFRRDRIIALGGYDENFVNAQDYALYLAGLRAGYRFAAVPEALARRHYSADNITVRRRYHQIMYSCAARIVHHAATGDRGSFFKTIIQYCKLALIPMWARHARRRLAGMTGRGV